MNYFKIYKNICRRGIDRINLSDMSSSGIYYEKHHIFMVSIYGKNKFITKLTAKEHIIAHRLLVKIYKNRYGVKSLQFNKAAHAFRMVCTRPKNIGTNRKPTSNDLALCRELNSVANTGDNNPSKRIEVRKKISAAKKGKSRVDMVGKMYFGTTQNIDEIRTKQLDTKKINMDVLEAQHGFRMKYTKNRKSRATNIEMNKKISDSKKERTNYIRSLSATDFYHIIVKEFLNKYTPENLSGRINSNFTNLFTCRKEKIDDYYEFANADGCKILTDFIDRRIRGGVI